jgi:hypothetical protein
MGQRDTWQCFYIFLSDFDVLWTNKEGMYGAFDRIVKVARIYGSLRMSQYS